MSTYWDIDDILAESQDVHCRYQGTTSARWLGFLDTENPAEDVRDNFQYIQDHITILLPPQSNIILPFWLGSHLARYSLFNPPVRILYVNPPKIYSNSASAEIRADPLSVDLKNSCPYYYLLGMKVVNLFNSAAIHEILKLVMNQRYKEMIVKTTVPAATHQYRALSSLTQSSSTNNSTSSTNASATSNSSSSSMLSSSSSQSFLLTPSLEIHNKLDHTERLMLAMKLRGLKGYEGFMRRTIETLGPSLLLTANSTTSTSTSLTFNMLQELKKKGMNGGRSGDAKKRKYHENSYRAANQRQDKRYRQ